MPFARLLALALLLLAAAPAAAQLPTAVQAFDDGNARYAEGDYEAALAAYARAADAGWASGALYLNMGNAFYRLDAVGEAIRHYERARRLMPDDPVLLHNLSIARARTRDQLSTLPTPLTVRAWHGVVRHAGAGGLFWSGALFFVVAVALAALWLLDRTWTAWHRRALTLSLVAALVLLPAAFAASAGLAHHPAAVVLAEAAPLLAEPGGEVETTIHEGLVLDVLDRRDDWLAVRLSNGTTGWVRADVVGWV